MYILGYIVLISVPLIIVTLYCMQVAVVAIDLLSPSKFTSKRQVYARLHPLWAWHEIIGYFNELPD